MGGTRTKNMKILMSGDTKPYQASVAQAGTSTKKFKKDASGALSDVANAFGVNLGPITGFTNKYTASLKGVYGGLLKTKTGAGIFSGAMKIVKVAMISTGIGALIVGVGALVAYFTKTQRGADNLKKAFAGIKAATDAVIDRVSFMGEGFFLSFQKAYLNVVQFVDKVKSKFKKEDAELQEAIEKRAKKLEKVNESILKHKQAGSDQGSLVDEMINEGKAAFRLERQLQALRDKEIALKQTQSDRELSIAKLRLIAKDEENYTNQQRLEALDKIAVVEKQRLKEDMDIAKERVRIMQNQIDLGESTAEELSDLADAKTAVNDLEIASLNLMRRLATERVTVINKINAETTATAALVAEKNKLAGLNADGSMNKLEGKKVEGGIAAPEAIGLHLDNEQLAADTAEAQSIWNDHVAYMQSTSLDLTDVINSTISDLANSTGQMLGNMMAGEEFEAFGSVVAGAFADMAGQVGKIAIAMGIAALGIDAALKSPSAGIGAIAAGVALVALSKATKAKLASAASSGGSTALSSGSYDARGLGANSSNVTAQQQSVQVEIVGALTASGSDLKLTLDKENTRQSVVT